MMMTGYIEELLNTNPAPGNGVGLKIWQCYDNLPAQQWFYTDDNRIKLNAPGLSNPIYIFIISSLTAAFLGQCVDLPNGVLTNSNRLQTWQCTAENNNQVWTL